MPSKWAPFVPPSWVPGRGGRWGRIAVSRLPLPHGQPLRRPLDESPMRASGRLSPEVTGEETCRPLLTCQQDGAQDLSPPSSRPRRPPHPRKVDGVDLQVQRHQCEIFHFGELKVLSNPRDLKPRPKARCNDFHGQHEGYSKNRWWGEGVRRCTIRRGPPNNS